MNPKKIFRYLSILTKYIIVKIFNKLFFLNNLKVIPSLESLNFSRIQYSSKSRRYIFRNRSNKIEKIIIDTSLLESDLCILGKKYNTPKSSLNDGHRVGYTGFYSLIFAGIKNNKINLAEIGIDQNGSSKMWRKYFKNANIYLFEYDKNKINNAKKDRLKKTSYHFTNVTSRKEITKSFKKLNKKFDIIIDDSTHFLRDQINVINSTFDFLNPGSFLIIEDIYKRYNENDYNIALGNLKKKFKKIIFIEVYNSNNYSASWRNEKLLVLIK
jgi:hypothetical protein